MAWTSNATWLLGGCLLTVCGCGALVALPALSVWRRLGEAAALGVVAVLALMMACGAIVAVIASRREQ